VNPSDTSSRLRVAAWCRLGWLARLLASAPLPAGARHHRDPSGARYFELPAGETSWQHPLARPFRASAELAARSEPLAGVLRDVLRGVAAAAPRCWPGGPDAAQWLLRCVAQRGPRRPGRDARGPVEPPQVAEMAEYLGLDSTERDSGLSDRALAWVALLAEALPLPDGWTEYVDASGRPYYHCRPNAMAASVADATEAQARAAARWMLDEAKACRGALGEPVARAAASPPPVPSEPAVRAARAARQHAERGGTTYEHPLDGLLRTLLADGRARLRAEALVDETTQRRDRDSTRERRERGMALPFWGPAPKGVARTGVGSDSIWWADPLAAGQAVPVAAPEGEGALDPGALRDAKTPTGGKSTMTSVAADDGVSAAAAERAEAEKKESRRAEKAAAAERAAAEEAKAAAVRAERERADREEKEAAAKLEKEKREANEAAAALKKEKAAKEKAALDHKAQVAAAAAVQREEQRKRAEAELAAGLAIREAADREAEAEAAAAAEAERRATSAMAEASAADTLPTKPKPKKVGSRMLGPSPDSTDPADARGGTRPVGAAGTTEAGAAVAALAGLRDRDPLAGLPHAGPAPEVSADGGGAGPAQPEPVPLLAPLDDRERAALRIAIGWRCHVRHREAIWLVMRERFRAEAASRVAAAWRGYSHRRIDRVVRGVMRDRRRRREMAAEGSAEAPSGVASGKSNMGGKTPTTTAGTPATTAALSGSQKSIAVSSEPGLGKGKGGTTRGAAANGLSDADREVVARAQAAEAAALAAAAAVRAAQLAKEAEEAEALAAELAPKLAAGASRAQRAASVRINAAARGALCRRRLGALAALARERGTLAARFARAYAWLYDFPDVDAEAAASAEGPEEPDPWGLRVPRRDRLWWWYVGQAAHMGPQSAGGGLGAGGVGGDLRAEAEVNARLARRLARLVAEAGKRRDERDALLARLRVLRDAAPGAARAADLEAERAGLVPPGRGAEAGQPPAKGVDGWLSAGALDGLRHGVERVLAALASDEGLLCDASAALKARVAVLWDAVGVTGRWRHASGLLREAPTYQGLGRIVEAVLRLEALARPVRPLRAAFESRTAVLATCRQLEATVEACEDAVALARELGAAGSSEGGADLEYVAAQRDALDRLEGAEADVGGWTALEEQAKRAVVRVKRACDALRAQGDALPVPWTEARKMLGAPSAEGLGSDLARVQATVARARDLQESLAETAGLWAGMEAAERARLGLAQRGVGEGPGAADEGGDAVGRLPGGRGRFGRGSGRESRRSGYEGTLERAGLTTPGGASGRDGSGGWRAEAAETQAVYRATHRSARGSEDGGGGESADRAAVGGRGPAAAGESARPGGRRRPLPARAASERPPAPSEADFSFDPNRDAGGVGSPAVRRPPTRNAVRALGGRVQPIATSTLGRSTGRIGPEEFGRGYGTGSEDDDDNDNDVRHSNGEAMGSDIDGGEAISDAGSDVSDAGSEGDRKRGRGRYALERADVTEGGEGGDGRDSAEDVNRSGQSAPGPKTRLGRLSKREVRAASSAKRATQGGAAGPSPLAVGSVTSTPPPVAADTRSTSVAAIAGGSPVGGKTPMLRAFFQPERDDGDDGSDEGGDGGALGLLASPEAVGTIGAAVAARTRGTEERLGRRPRRQASWRAPSGHENPALARPPVLNLDATAPVAIPDAVASGVADALGRANPLDSSPPPGDGKGGGFFERRRLARASRRSQNNG